jgi:hypothetical protein
LSIVFELPHGGSHPRVAYTNASGEKDWIPANGFIFGYKIGERVRVLYDPDPEIRQINDFRDFFYSTKPDIDDFGALYASIYFEGILGICSIGMGLMELFG